MPRAGWVLTVVAVGFAARAGAQPLEPPGQPPAPARPGPVLGAPVAVASPSPRLTPTGFVDAPAEPKPSRGAAFGAPTAAVSFGSPTAADGPGVPVAAEVVDRAVARTAHTAPADDPVRTFLGKRSELKGEAGEKAAPKGAPDRTSKFGERLEGIFGNRNGGWFRSDHMYDNFISPVSNPFLAEDPRSVTEVRPLFLFQKVPGDQRDFRGGSLFFFGTQARVAFSDRWSFVLNKLGGQRVDTGTGSPFPDSTGFAEVWLGPKWTFYRGEENGVLVAAGLQFQLPVGSRDALQDTGSLSLVPYVSYGQNFLRGFQYGSFNSIISTGYSFSTNNQRNSYYYLTAHLDFDVMNAHRFYPVAELNWFLTTTSARARDIGIDGRDLINFGGQARHGLLTGALGGRVKLTESAQFGTTFEIPFAGPKDLFRYRFTLDFILRY